MWFIFPKNRGLEVTRNQKQYHERIAHKEAYFREENQETKKIGRKLRCPLFIHGLIKEIKNNNYVKLTF